MRLKGKLVTISGRIIDITDKLNQATVLYYKILKKEEKIYVQRVINCTGPETDIRRSDNELLRNLTAYKLIKPDALNLGIEADAATGAVINGNGEKIESIFTIGNNLKGILWESTSVPELRIQTKASCVVYF